MWEEKWTTAKPQCLNTQERVGSSAKTEESSTDSLSTRKAVKVKVYMESNAIGWLIRYWDNEEIIF